MNEEKKPKTLGQILGDLLAVAGVVIILSDAIKGCQRDRERNRYPRTSGYTEEEERIITDYLYEQEQFDREYGTGKQERM